MGDGLVHFADAEVVVGDSGEDEYTLTRAMCGAEDANMFTWKPEQVTCEACLKLIGGGHD